MASRLFGRFSGPLMAAAKSSSSSTSGLKAPSKASGGLKKLLPLSPQLGQFIGASEGSRSEAVKKVWEYIKLHNLQNPANKKEIYCDEKLKTIFAGKEVVGFTEIAGLLSAHFVKST